MIYITKSFIRTLIKEEKIKIIEPNNTIADSYLEKSQKSLVSAKTILNIKNYDDAVALTYYSMYYSVLALLFKCGIKSENHSGTIILLKKIFEINNEEISYAKKERIDKQYYIDFKATDIDVQAGIEAAEEFNSILKNKIDTMQQKEIQDYFNRAKKLLF